MTAEEDLARLKAKSGNPPSRHHFMPVFMLKRWATPDHQGALKVVEYRRRGGVVKPLHRAPDATGFVKDGFSMPLVPGAARSMLESQFFRPLDGLAAEALACLATDGPDGLDGRRRSAWCGFLMSLRYRSPAKLRRIKATYRAMWRAEASAEAEAMYAAEKTEDHPATLAEFLASLPDEEIDQSLLEELPNLIENPNVGKFTFGMRWSVLNVTAGGHEFLLGDSPLNGSNGVAAEDGHLYLPIGPRQLFVACRDAGVENDMQRVDPIHIIKKCNQVAVETASEVVWARDERQGRFIGNRFGAMADADR